MIPDWLEVDAENPKATVKELPQVKQSMFLLMRCLLSSYILNNIEDSCILVKSPKTESRAAGCIAWRLGKTNILKTHKEGLCSVDFNKPNIEITDVSEDKKYGRFVVEPLERGYGTTLGNSLRRIMLFPSGSSHQFR